MDHFLCPRCGQREQPANPQAAHRLREVGRCQGCRALDTLTSRPWLLPLFVEFWKWAGFPASDSWLRSSPCPGDKPPGEGSAPRQLPSAGDTSGLAN